MNAFTRCGTVLPWSAAREQQFTFESIYDGTIHVYKRSADGKSIEVPRGTVKLQEDLRDSGIDINFNTSLFQSQKPEQSQVIQQAVKLLTEDQQFILAAPTGWGKTYVGTQIAGLMHKRFCVITTKEDIVSQWIKAIQETLGLTVDEIGIWRGDQVPAPHHKAVVALIQSVMKGPERYGEEAYQEFGLVLCDEVHRMGAEGFSQAMWHFPSKLRMGMSATPWRKDGKDRVFQWHIGPVLVEATMEVLIPKILRQLTGWKVPRSSGGQIPHDFGNISLLMKPMSRNPQRNALIVKYLKSTWEKGRSTIAFSQNLEHLSILRDLLQVSGVPELDIGFYVGCPSEFYGSKKGESNRKTADLVAREKHKTRPILLSTYSMASEATNIPWLDTCILMTPMAKVEQIVGRIRREYENKKPPVVVDLIDADSSVLAAYANSRLKWYTALGSSIVNYD